MEYPAKTCEIDKLIRHPKLIAATLARKKTQQRRNGIYAYPGEMFELEGIRLIITDLYPQTLGAMTDHDAQAEGYPDLESYKTLILKMHAGLKWNDNDSVWVHCFAIMYSQN